MSDKKYTNIKHDDAAGSVEFSDGKAVWQWNQDANDSTSVLIKSLDNPDLALEATRRTPIAHPKGGPPAAANKPQRPATRSDEEDADLEMPDSGGSGFDPYNSS